MDSKPRDSLIKYENPIEINLQSNASKLANVQVNKKKAVVPLFESKPTTEDVLNAILPPREWTYEGKHYIQYVSHNLASRDDVSELQKRLDEQLIDKQARESGIDPIREELHSQGFDEIIRQVTIDCPERGLLLMRVRDEAKMTIAAYQTLYKSSVFFGSKKLIQAESGKTKLEEEITRLEDHKQTLINKIIELRNKRDGIEKRNQERRSIEQKRRADEKQVLRDQKQNLKNFVIQLGIDYEKIENPPAEVKEEDTKKVDSDEEDEENEEH